MAPPAKKAKTSKGIDKPTMPGPIIFKARGLNTDVRLRAFETDFHVHSVFLKIHSAFFFKFLDSADKTAALTNLTLAGGFKYEWITKIDGDRSWSLVAEGKEDEQGVQAEDFDKFKGDKNKGVEAFKKLLEAFYGELYKLESVMELKRMTQLANYYCALPALSRSIHLPLFRGDIAVRYSPTVLIGVATKLRHAALFRECVVWLAGRWSRTSFWNMIELDKKIHKTVMKARNQIGFMVAKVHEELLVMTRYNSDDAHRLAQIEYDCEVGLPRYFYKVSKGYWGDFDEDIRGELLPVLKNNLLYSGSELEASSIEHLYEDYLPCATVDDDDLPWDRSQTDW